MVTGIGCTGRVAGYVRLDSFHTTHGRAIPFATGLKLANPDLNVVVYSGDGDLSAIGGNHLIHAARRNIDIKVICVNNLIYAMTGGQSGPTTPATATTSTSPYGAFEPSFNLPQLADAAGAVYVARWTTFHVRQLTRSMNEMLRKKGFCFIEVLSPCPTLYQRRNKLGDGLDTMKYYKEKQQDPQRRAHQRGARSACEARSSSASSWTASGPTTSSLLRNQMTAQLGDRYVEAGVPAHAIDRDSHRRLRRPGRDSLRHHHRQGRLHLPGRLRHHDPELRAGSARRGLRARRSFFPTNRFSTLTSPSPTSWSSCPRRPTRASPRS